MATHRFNPYLIPVTIVSLIAWLGIIAFLAFGMSGCAPIQRKPGQLVTDFCEEYALMRPSVPEHSFLYWYNECLHREYARGDER